MNENILVCINYIKNAESLVKRGSLLAKALGGTLSVVHVKVKEEHEMDYYWLEKKELLERLCHKHQAKLLVVPLSHGKKVADEIAYQANQNDIKQIVLGQPARNKWEILKNGSIINDLFYRLEGIDLHIVEVTKESMVLEKQYERGTEASLKEDGNELKLLLHHTDGSEINGLFFQDTSTDFESGLFKVMNAEHVLIYKVTKGISSPSNVTFIQK